MMCDISGKMNFVGESWNDIKQYVSEYKEIIKVRDQLKLPFQHMLTQLDSRASIIDHLKNVALSKKQIHSTLHLAVYILDVFMDRHIISSHKLLLVGNVCLLIAAKMDEHSHSIPKLADLNGSVGDIYKIEEYKELEVYILNSFDCFINFPTPAYYAHYYFQAILDYEDLKTIKSKKVTIREAYTELNYTLIASLDRFIEDIHYMQYYPASTLAAAALSASRLKFGLSSWNLQLQQFTDFTGEDIKEICGFLMQPNPLMCTYCQHCNQ